MKIFYTAILVLISSQQVISQSVTGDSVRNFAAELAMLEAELDSSGIFSLIDSVLSTESIKPPSELNFRLGYSSNVTNAGRDFGVNQYGLSPGISFYHSNGLFADLSGFWNSEFDPKYNITLASIGYLGRLGKRVTFASSYEKWFYHSDNSQIADSPSNSLGATFDYNYKFLSSGIDYSFLFGATNAHRISANIGASLSTKKLIKNTTISFLPSFSVLYGNQIVNIQFTGRLIDEVRSNAYLRENLQSEEFQEFLTNVELTAEEIETIENIQNNRFFSDERKRNLIAVVYFVNPEVREYLFEQLEERNEEYGIMNYNFNFPISISFKKYLFLLSYSYSIPVELPGETFELDPIGLFSFTVIYRIPF